jgi:chemotaxis protein MotB
MPQRARPGARSNPWRFRTLGALTLILATSSSGCWVHKDLYTQALADLQFERNRSVELGKKLKAAQDELAKLQAAMRDRDLKLQEATVAHADLTRKLDEMTVLNQALQDRLRAAGHSLDQVSAEKGSLAAALAETRKQLDELKKQQAAAEARLAQFQDLVKKFQKLADAGKLRVVLRQGRMVIELPNDVLFDSGKSEVKQAGKGTIGDVGKILATMPDRRFQVAGHTDNVKIQTARFPSNWELSTARAVEVVKLLVGAKVKPENLSAAGYGEFDPVAPNATAKGRARNRRIEIAVQTQVDELVALPQ